MKHTIEIELTDAQWKLVRSMSLERMINNAINIGGLAQAQLKEESNREDGSSLWQDFEELKPLLMIIWRAVHNVAMIKTSRV